MNYSLKTLVKELRKLDKLVPLEDLFSKGGYKLQVTSEEAMKAKEKSFKELGFETRTWIYTGSGHYASCMKNEYYVYVSLN